MMNSFNVHDAATCGGGSSAHSDISEMDQHEILSKARTLIDSAMNKSCARCQSLERQLKEAVGSRCQLECRVVELEEQLSELRARVDIDHQFASTVISERTQEEIDNVILKLKQENTRLQAEIVELRDTIGALRCQVELYKSDFESERSDRESAHGRLADAQSDLDVVRHQLADCETKLQDAWTQLKNAVNFNAQQTKVMRALKNGGGQSQQRTSNPLLRSRGFDVTDGVPTTAAASSSSEMAESSQLVDKLSSLTESFRRQSSPSPLRQQSSSSSSSSSRNPSPSTAVADLVDLVDLDSLDGGNLVADGVGDVRHSRWQGSELRYGEAAALNNFVLLADERERRRSPALQHASPARSSSPQQPLCMFPVSDDPFHRRK